MVVNPHEATAATHRRLHVAVVINPTAGRGRARTLAPRALAVLEAEPTLHLSVIQGRDATEAAALLRQQVASGVAAVVAIGGDGTVSLALQAVAGTGIPLGVIAAGTGDDVARQHLLPRHRVEEAALAVRKALVDGRVRAVDAALVEAADGESRWFLTVMACGFDAVVNDLANTMRWPRGTARYVVAMVRVLRQFRPFRFRITADGTERHTDAMLVAVGNGASYGGGMLVCAGADAHDGLLTLTVVGPLRRLPFLGIFPRVYRGTHVHHPKVHQLEAREVGIALEGPSVGSTDVNRRASAWADGERIGELPVVVRCVPDAVRLLA